MADEPHEETEEELEARLRKLLGEADTADDAELNELELKLRDVEDKLSAQEQSRKSENGMFDSEFQARLDRLHEKADMAKSRIEGKKREQRRSWNAERDSAKGLGFGLQVAYTIIGLPLVGVAIGWFVDSRMGTTMGKGIGVLLGAVLGIGMAIAMLNRSNQD